MKKPYTVRWETEEHGEITSHVWQSFRMPVKQGIWLNVGSLGLNLHTIVTGSLTVSPKVVEEVTND